MHPATPRPEPTHPYRQYRDLNRALLAVLLLAGGVTLIRLLVGAFLPLPLGSCASQRLLGVDCPLCGLTRGMVALLSGDLGQALAWNPLTPAVACLLVLELACRAVASHDAGARILAPVRRADLLLHVCLGLLYVLYAVAFSALQWAEPVQP